MHSGTTRTARGGRWLLLAIACGAYAEGRDAAANPPAQRAGAVASTTTLSANPDPSNLQQAVFLTATVAGDVPTGSVTFSEGATVFCGGAVALRADATARCTVTTFAAGPHAIVAAYGGDVRNLPSTSAAEPHTVSTLIDTVQIFFSPCLRLPVDPGEPFTYGVRMFAGASPLEGEVVFYEGATTLCTLPLVAGQATCTTTALTAIGDAPLLPLTVRALYPGDGVHAPADSGGFPVTVRNPSVHLFRAGFEFSTTCPTQGPSLPASP